MPDDYPWAHPVVVNPLAAMKDAAGTAQTLYDVRQSRAKEAAGDAFRQSVNPDGSFDSAGFYKRLAADPNTAMYAQESAQKGQVFDKDTYDLHTKRLDSMNGAMTQLLAENPNGVSADQLHAKIDQGVAQRLITPEQAQVFHAQVSDNPYANSRLLLGGVMRGMSAREQLEAARPTPKMPDVGPGLQPTQETPAGSTAPRTISPSGPLIPKELSPAEEADLRQFMDKPVPGGWIGPNGKHKDGTYSQMITDTGQNPRQVYRDWRARQSYGGQPVAPTAPVPRPGGGGGGPPVPPPPPSGPSGLPASAGYRERPGTGAGTGEGAGAGAGAAGAAAPAAPAPPGSGAAAPAAPPAPAAPSGGSASAVAPGAGAYLAGRFGAGAGAAAAQQGDGSYQVASAGDSLPPPPTITPGGSMTGKPIEGQSPVEQEVQKRDVTLREDATKTIDPIKQNIYANEDALEALKFARTGPGTKTAAQIYAFLQAQDLSLAVPKGGMTETEWRQVLVKNLTKLAENRARLATNQGQQTALHSNPNADEMTNTANEHVLIRMLGIQRQEAAMKILMPEPSAKGSVEKHLRTYQSETDPRAFAWDAYDDDTREAIRQDALNRGGKNGKAYKRLMKGLEDAHKAGLIDVPGPEEKPAATPPAATPAPGKGALLLPPPSVAQAPNALNGPAYG